MWRLKINHKKTEPIARSHSQTLCLCRSNLRRIEYHEDRTRCVPAAQPQRIPRAHLNRRPTLNASIRRLLPALCALLLMACGPGSQEPSGVRVAASEFRFEPASLTLKANTPTTL